ncbi:hypothetical protein C2845_PM09G16980 [Panicum miliaceum]|uniref:Uncharacterized protein n=1 Tax=Panicum miliaceum TaxID=4540 RepID=A0A3L6RXD1_PANMI|nr:hypothetical protein C2845_PM09G16980 [Panicum miliaceum]
MALVLCRRVWPTFRMGLVNGYPTSAIVPMATCAGDPPAVTTAKPSAASTKGDCSHAPKAPAKKPAGCDPQGSSPAVEPPPYPPSGDCPCVPQEDQPVGPGEGSRHDPRPPIHDP